MMYPTPAFSISIGEQIAFGEKDSTLTFHDVCRAGFEAVELCLYFQQPRTYTVDDAKRVGDLAGEASLTLRSMHGYCNAAPEDPGTHQTVIDLNLNHIEFMRRLGIEVLVLHLPTIETPSTAENIAVALDALAALEPPARDAGIRIAVENLFHPHQHDANAFFGAIFDAYDPRSVGLCYDSGHALITGDVSLLQRFAHRLIALHLHDNNGREDQHLPPGKGIADWQSIRCILQKAGFDGPVHLEVNRSEEGSDSDFLVTAYAAIADLWNAAP